VRSFAFGSLLSSFMNIALGIVMLERRSCEDATCNSSRSRVARTVAALAGFDLVAILIQVFFALN
jgi:hypothetical protein